MSDVNIHYASGHIKPLSSPPLSVLGDGNNATTDQTEILQRLREAWAPIQEPDHLPHSPHPDLA
eukprot:514396-Amphidinium_carterae.1